MKKKKLSLTRTTITALTGANLDRVRGGGDDSASCEGSDCCAGPRSVCDTSRVIRMCGTTYTMMGCQTPTTADGGGQGL